MEFAVDIPDQWVHRAESQLALFQVEAVSDPLWFHYSIVPELTPPRSECVRYVPGQTVFREDEWEICYFGTTWQTAYGRAMYRGRECRVEIKASECVEGITARIVLDVMRLPHLAAQAGGVFFHCSFIEHDGRAILFTAPSGTGKSTQAELWRDLRGARIINGDRALIRRVGGQIMAEGIPFSGSSADCENASFPLAAIVYLTQAPKTEISRLGGYRAFSRIWEGININTWEQGDAEKASGLVQDLAVNVPIYYLPCTPDESAVTALEQALESR